MASAYLTRLFDEYRRAAKSGQDEMESWTSAPTAEQIEKRDRALADVARLKAEIDKVSNFEDLRQAGDAFRHLAAPVVERAAGKSTGDMSLRELLANVRTYGGFSVDFTRPTPPDMTLRALQSAGGSAVETSFADFVTVYARTLTPMLNPSVVKVLDRSDGSPLVLPRVTADPNHGGTVTAEAAGINELDATFSAVTLNPYKYAVTNLWSSELGQDTAIPLEETVALTTARELTIDIGAHMTTGDGSGKPQGFIGAATNGGTATGTGSTYGTYFGPTDLVSLFYGLAAPYRANASWQANATTIAQIRNARDTAGNHIWAPSIAVGQPETVLGRPLFENPAMANGSAASSVAVGDFSRYVVALVAPRVEGSIHYKFNTDQIALRTIYRVDGDLLNADAIRYLVGAAV